MPNSGVFLSEHWLAGRRGRERRKCRKDAWRAAKETVRKSYLESHVEKGKCGYGLEIKLDFS